MFQILERTFSNHWGYVIQGYTTVIQINIIQATDTTTIKEVKANLVNKLVGLDTINAVDVTKFSLFEVKDTKGMQG